jgi:hypothetical protein
MARAVVALASTTEIQELNQATWQAAWPSLMNPVPANKVVGQAPSTVDL